MHIRDGADEGRAEENRVEGGRPPRTFVTGPAAGRPAPPPDRLLASRSATRFPVALSLHAARPSVYVAKRVSSRGSTSDQGTACGRRAIEPALEAAARVERPAMRRRRLCAYCLPRLACLLFGCDAGAAPPGEAPPAPLAEPSDP